MSDKIDRLVEAAIALCEPENGDEKATAYTRETLRKKFSEILHPQPKPLDPTDYEHRCVGTKLSYFTPRS